MATKYIIQQLLRWRERLEKESIAVLYGGVSAEREVSLRSGQSIVKALTEEGLNVTGYDVRSLNDLVDVAANHCLVFLALHGRWGEDGQVQAVLQSLGVVFTGSGMAASALAMDKIRTKYVWQGAGLPTPAFYRVNKASLTTLLWSNMPLPAMVKASHEGSSIGLFKVNTLDELKWAVEQALQLDDEVLVEQWVSGREFTFAILASEVLPAIELKTQHDFYDYDAKYVSGDTEYLCPVSLMQSELASMNELVLKAFDVLGAQGIGRIDIMLDEIGQPWLIELNTLPGMTDMSLVPKAAKHYGLSYGELCIAILGQAVDASPLA
ncbi:D-alanine--D-alanine ligase [Thiomicrospira aerophila AL3]|uniref:D-alanine--D-alanine ligase n=1 Tax=Thiomicrospira aerophila AL3 TaxID=717772 RepID=W0DQ14_9GAMM|nr:D-alanine--D-alanine ligase [Thiomicrospira aerophila]AHF00557.1 D-alanine--D-alanine ligase [Thiomicrospira aerophila AL3]